MPCAPDAAAADRQADAIEAGTNPEAVAFPASAFPRVLDAAGFRIELRPLDAPVSDGGDASGGFDPRDRPLLDDVELRLRTFVETALRAMDGQAWVRRRVPKGLRDKWRDRRQQDRDRRGACYAPIHCADLAELLDVICRRHAGRTRFGAWSSTRRNSRWACGGSCRSATRSRATARPHRPAVPGLRSAPAAACARRGGLAADAATEPPGRRPGANR